RKTTERTTTSATLRPAANETNVVPSSPAARGPPDRFMFRWSFPHFIVSLVVNSLGGLIWCRLTSSCILFEICNSRYRFAHYAKMDYCSGGFLIHPLWTLPAALMGPLTNPIACMIPLIRLLIP